MAIPLGNESLVPPAGVEAPTAEAPTALTLPAAPPRPLAGNQLVPSAPVTFRSFSDVDAMRKSIFDNVVKSIQSKYPIENQRYRLELADVGYKGEKPFSLAEQKTAIMQGHTLQHQLTGTWRLVNKADNKVVDEKSGVVAHVPYMTQRGTFIYNGSEYTVNNQMRLRPGVYARVKENGILEAHFNARPGTGPSFRVYMEPDTGIFRAGVGQSELKLYPILRAMGVSDEEIGKHWGKELLQKNMEAADPRAVARAFAKMVYTRADANTEDRKDDESTEEADAGEAEGVAKAAEACSRVSITSDHEQKEAQIGRDVSDRKWRYLWQTGKLRSTDSGWVLLDVHKGLCESAYHNLKMEGIDCEPKFDNPHISVLRKEEVDELKKKHGLKWEGVARIGQPFKFYLKRMVDLVPHDWDGMDRVWFLEVESPQLRKYRKSLGFPELPKNDSHGYDMRFHITFAVHRGARKAAELFTERRANYGVGDGLLDGYETFQKAAAEGWLIQLLQKRAADDDKSGEQLKQVFDKIELDPNVTKMTLGQAHANAGPGAILRASQKLLNISRGQEEVDDRDSLAFQQFHGPEDFFAERIHKDAGQTGRKLLWKATLRGNLKHVPSGALTPQIYSVLLRSGLGQPLEEVNPIEIMDQQLRVVRTGDGGIGSLDSVPMESRNVQPSHMGYIDPVRSPESSSIGIDSRVTHGTMKGSDGKIYTNMINAKTGRQEMVAADKAARSTVAFPGEMERGGKRVRAMVKAHQVEFVGPHEVDYVLPHPSNMFTSGSNLVPMIGGSKAGRLLMGAKFINQALALEHPEEPFVQNLAASGKSFDETYGEQVGAIKARASGVVTDIGDDHISVKYADGTTQSHELYQNFPFNRKSFLHNTPAVKIGDRVKPGTLLAKSNYTNDKGTMAVGRNLRVAYIPYRGLNYEDAVLLSESAAKAMSSEHLYQNTLSDLEGTMDIGRKQFISLFPGKFKPEQIKNIGDDGTIKPGTKVKKGDPLVLALNRTQIDAVHHGRKPMFMDATVTWDHDSDGTVTDVAPLKEGGFNVTVKSYMPSQEGDKFAGRWGDKGVCARIIADEQMPHDSEGRPMEMLLNPLGVISRGNPSQIFEALLGKVARKRGEPYKLPAFQDESWIDYVRRELQQNGLKDTEDLTDPKTGRRIPGVLTGERFIMKLHHTAESKSTGRDIGGYTSEGQPSKGGSEGSKRIGSMELNALLSHGATNVIRDAHLVRGQQNDDYWKLFRLGMNPPSPRQPFIYSKFLSYLVGAGVNIKKQGNRMQLFALTDKDVEQMSGGALQNADTVSGDKLKPTPGGLFDESLTGGHNGAKWSHVELAEPVPNPVMEEPIRRLLGLTQHKFEDLLAGRINIDGESGGKGIKNLLSKVNVDDAIRQNEAALDSGSVSKHDEAAKMLGYLKTMKQYDLKPQDWVVSKVPVLPPSMRPVTAFRGMQLTADPNYLYRDLFLANEDMKELRAVAGDQALGDERLRLYNGYKAITGFGDPIQPKTQEKGVHGLLAHIFGGSPKMGLYQRRVLGTSTDMVGRSTITPNPDLNMDQVGLPEEKAWTIYRPFIVRRLIRRGMPATEAAKAVANRSPDALGAMKEELKVRPVIVNRAPTLHKYGFMAAWPVLTKGHTLQISPTVTPGYSADFDGNCVRGLSKVALKFACNTGTANDRIVEMSIKDVPHLPETLRHDKNGAAVYDALPGISTLSYDSSKACAVWQPVTQLTIEKDREVVLVKTDGGHEVVCTPNESLAVYEHATGDLVKAIPAEAANRLCAVVGMPSVKEVEGKVDIVPVPDAIMAVATTPIGLLGIHRLLLEFNSVAGRKPYYYVSREMAQRLCTLLSAAQLPADLSECFEKWQRLVAAVGIGWTSVTSVEPAGREDVYDLAVTGTKVFAVDGGLIVYDTCNYHVPVTDDAVAEAVNKMMPSKNLKAIKDFGVHYLPNQEFVLGLYLASKAKNDKVPPRVFRGQADVLSAFWRGEIGATDRVHVKE